MNNYQELAMRTMNKNAKKEKQIINAALGLAGESGEVADLIKKWQFQGHELSAEKVKNELGDICWYIALMATALDFTLDEVLQMNIDKLKNRYPDGFEVERSIERHEN